MKYLLLIILLLLFPVRLAVGILFMPGESLKESVTFVLTKLISELFHILE